MSKLLRFVRESNDDSVFITNPAEVLGWLQTNCNGAIWNEGITYTLQDGRVTINGDIGVILPFSKPSKTLMFSVIHGQFNASNNNLTSVRGFPQHVDKIFDVSNNRLPNLVGCPEYVGGKYMADHNNLTSLKGCPTMIFGTFMINNNKLSTLEHGPKVVHGNVYAGFNKLTSFEGFPKHIHGNLVINGNHISSFHYIHKHITELNGYLEFDPATVKGSVLGLLLIKGLKGLQSVSSSKVPEWAKIVHKHIANAAFDGKDINGLIYDVQEALLNAGLEDYAQL